MPYFGLGVYLSSEGTECMDSITHALNQGYRLIDTASFYANERSVGEAVRNSGLDRKQIFVTTKVWNSDQGYDNTLKAFEDSYDKLNIDYVDLYLVHYPVKDKRKDTWRAMERLAEEGVCKAIGISNYMKHHLQEILSHCNIPPAVNQIELSPFCYESRKPTIELCAENDIVIQAYAPLTRGRKLKDQYLNKLSEKYAKTPAQVLLRWALEHGFSVIPKSSKKLRIEENSAIFDFALGADEVIQLQELESDFLVCWDPMETP